MRVYKASALQDNTLVAAIATPPLPQLAASGARHTYATYATMPHVARRVDTASARYARGDYCRQPLRHYDVITSLHMPYVDIIEAASHDWADTLII